MSPLITNIEICHVTPAGQKNATLFVQQYMWSQQYNTVIATAKKHIHQASPTL